MEKESGIRGDSKDSTSNLNWSAQRALGQGTYVFQTAKDSRRVGILTTPKHDLPVLEKWTSQ